jgi:hypothetical protein
MLEIISVSQEVFLVPLSKVYIYTFKFMAGYLRFAWTLGTNLTLAPAMVDHTDM